MIKALMLVVLFCTLFGCTGVPSGVEVVKTFDPNRYMGKWYEIARLDHSFERNLNNVSANYTLRDEGIDVLNRGYNYKNKKWQEAKGRAYFLGEKNEPKLKVTFFWPFYGGYNLIALDQKNYSYAMVCGPDRSYLWILAREKTIDPEILKSLTELADQMGFDIDELIFVEHNLEDPKSS